jgi:hypothetical protein
VTKPIGKRPPSNKRFRLLVDNQPIREVTCVTDAGLFIKQAFRTGAQSITVVKLRNANASKDQETIAV